MRRRGRGQQGVLCLVSRVTPVQTALRNCTGDEGRPFGFGDQVADPKPPRAAAVKSRGGERRDGISLLRPRREPCGPEHFRPFDQKSHTHVKKSVPAQQRPRSMAHPVQRVSHNPVITPVPVLARHANQGDDQSRRVWLARRPRGASVDLSIGPSGSGFRRPDIRSAPAALAHCPRDVSQDPRPIHNGPLPRASAMALLIATQ
jgi:hypothetical protein